MALLDQGWTEGQAQGLLDCPQGLLLSAQPEACISSDTGWCGQRRKNPKTIEAQLDFHLPMSFATSMRISARHSDKKEPEERHD